MSRSSLMCMLLVFSLSAGSALAADPAAKAKMAPSPQSQIKKALKAGPASITEQAAVKDMSGKVLRAGSNNWTCYPDPDPMCLDATWEKWMQAYMAKSAFHTDTVGLAYMLAGDSADASNIDPFAAGPTSDNQWVTEGPHVMVLVPDPKQLNDVSTDPNNGGPYVMWKGTPYAHIMLPVDKRAKH